VQKDEFFKLLATGDWANLNFISNDSTLNVNIKKEK